MDDHPFQVNDPIPVVQSDRQAKILLYLTGGDGNGNYSWVQTNEANATLANYTTGNFALSGNLTSLPAQEVNFRGDLANGTRAWGTLGIGRNKYLFQATGGNGSTPLLYEVTGNTATSPPVFSGKRKTRDSGNNVVDYSPAANLTTILNPASAALAIGTLLDVVPIADQPSYYWGFPAVDTSGNGTSVYLGRVLTTGNTTNPGNATRLTITSDANGTITTANATPTSVLFYPTTTSNSTASAVASFPIAQQVLLVQVSDFPSRYVALPVQAAGNSAAGWISLEDQTWFGNKTFTSNITVNGVAANITNNLNVGVVANVSQQINLRPTGTLNGTAAGDGYPVVALGNLNRGAGGPWVGSFQLGIYMQPSDFPGIYASYTAGGMQLTTGTIGNATGMLTATAGGINFGSNVTQIALGYGAFPFDFLQFTFPIGGALSAFGNVTGSRGNGTAFANLLTLLDSRGLIKNNTTA